MQENVNKATEKWNKPFIVQYKNGEQITYSEPISFDELEKSK